MWKIEKIVSKGDYQYAVVKEHPNKTKNNYVLLHRVIVENHLGRLLNSDEVVHHINGDKRDNRIENLQVMTNVEHALLHSSEKTREVCKLKCPECGKIFYKQKGQTHLSKKGKSTFCSRSCNGKFSRKIQIHGLTVEMETAITENVLEIRKLRANQKQWDA